MSTKSKPNTLMSQSNAFSSPLKTTWERALMREKEYQNT